MSEYELNGYINLIQAYAGTIRNWARLSDDDCGNHACLMNENKFRDDLQSAVRNMASACNGLAFTDDVKKSA